MTCWFHKWEVVHREEPLEGFWFEDRKCKKCGKEEIIDGYPFFSSISDCVTLGARIGCYKALGKGKIEKMIDDEIDRQLKAKGLTRADLKVQRTKT